MFSLMAETLAVNSSDLTEGIHLRFDLVPFLLVLFSHLFDVLKLFRHQFSRVLFNDLAESISKHIHVPLPFCLIVGECRLNLLKDNGAVLLCLC